MARRRRGLDLSDDRKALKDVQALAQFEGDPMGPIFRCKRVGLQLTPRELGWVQPKSTRWTSKPTWVQYEDGDHGPPPGGWSMWVDALNRAFAGEVAFLKSIGTSAADIRMDGWSLREIISGRGYTEREIRAKLAEPTRTSA